MLLLQRLALAGIGLHKLLDLSLFLLQEGVQGLRGQHLLRGQCLQSLLAPSHRIFPGLAGVFFQEREAFAGILQFGRQHHDRSLQAGEFFTQRFNTGVILLPKVCQGRFFLGQKTLLPFFQRREFLLQLPLFLHKPLRRSHIHLQGTQVQINPKEGIPLCFRRKQVLGIENSTFIGHLADILFPAGLVLGKPLDEGAVHRGKELVDFRNLGIQALHLRPYVRKLVVPFTRFPMLLELPFLHEFLYKRLLRFCRCLQAAFFAGKARLLVSGSLNLLGKRRKMSCERKLFICCCHPLLQVREQAFLRRYAIPEGLIHTREPRLKSLRELLDLRIQRCANLYLSPLPGCTPSVKAQFQFPLVVLVLGRDIGILPGEPVTERLGRFQRGL